MGTRAGFSAKQVAKKIETSLDMWPGACSVIAHKLIEYEAERPERVLVAIWTDGLENSSSDYTRQQIFDMITHQREVYKWEFVFLAANQDAIAEGNKLGVAVNANWQPTKDGLSRAYHAFTSSVSCYRKGGNAADAYQ